MASELKIDKGVETALGQRHYAEGQKQQTTHIRDQLRWALFREKSMDPAAVGAEHEGQRGTERHGSRGRGEPCQQRRRGGKRLKTEHRRNHPKTLGDRVGTEQGEEQHDAQQGIDPAEDSPGEALLQTVNGNDPASLQAGEQAVAQAPEHEGPVCPVPQTGAEEDKQTVQRGTAPAAAAAAEGKVQILPEPGGEGDVPLTPEVADGGRRIGEEKVLPDGEAEHPSHADGHVAVTRKVKVNLQRVADSAQPGEAGIHDRGAEHRVDHDRGGVGQQELLAEADDEAPDPGGGLRGGAPALVNLRRDIAPADDGTGDQLREEGDIEQELQKTPAVILGPAIDVNGVAQPLEGEERDPDGENQTHGFQGETGDGIEVRNQEVGVLVDAENPEVQQNVERDDRPAARKARPEQEPGEIVQQDRAEKQRNVVQIPEGVEDKTGDGQKNILIPAAEGKPVQQKDRGQKTEEENRRAEYQTIFPLPLRMIKTV